MAPNGTGRKSTDSLTRQAPTFIIHHADNDTAPTPTTDGKTKNLVNFFTRTTASANASVKFKDEIKKRLPKASKPGNWDSDIAGGTQPITTTPTAVVLFHFVVQTN